MAGDTIGTVARWLVIIGAINWGLAGVGGFLGSNLNVVNLIVGSISALENLVYVLVGLSGLWQLKAALGK
jgi:uncharacterized protein